MMPEGVQEKSFAFAKRIVKLYQFLRREQYASIYTEGEELKKLLTSITKTTRESLTPHS